LLFRSRNQNINKAYKGLHTDQNASKSRMVHALGSEKLKA